MIQESTLSPEVTGTAPQPKVPAHGPLGSLKGAVCVHVCVCAHVSSCVCWHMTWVHVRTRACALRDRVPHSDVPPGGQVSTYGHV